MNTIQAKKISIIEFLSSLGQYPEKVKGNQHYYLSPLRKEDNPSFFVNDKKNVWFDFRSGTGGTIIDLVMAIQKASSISESLKYLKNLNLVPDENFEKIENISKLGSPKQILITEIVPIQDNELLKYVNSRNINLDIAKKYCYEMHYQVVFSHFKAIAFPNDTPDGYVLRSHSFKGCTAQDISIVPGKDSSNKNCLIFEGFFDFLSYLTLKNEFHSEATSIVLNSNYNIEKAIQFVQEHHLKPSLLFDNDASGKDGVRKILKAVSNATDFSEIYSDYKDLYEFLCAKVSDHKSINKNCSEEEESSEIEDEK